MADLKYQNRRDFLRFVLGSAALVYAGDALAVRTLLKEKGFERLSILYTNDQHSRIEPFPDNDPKYPGEGGFAKRAAIIEKKRVEKGHVLLLDAGDIFQGTPYFNYFSGELEYRLMSMMKYDATTFGNHDFDLGCENILKQMPHASFDFINCNYDFAETVLAGNKKISPYRIFKRGNLKIGVLGIGIDLENLVDKKYVKGIRYLDPVKQVEYFSPILKNDEKCDYIICLSHLGYKYTENKISDVLLASQTKNIDLIIGGHTHTFLDAPVVVKNSVGVETLITQMGWAGIWLGDAEVLFSEKRKKISHSNARHNVL